MARGKKDLNTYATNICLIRMSEVRYKGLWIVPSYAAQAEFTKMGKTMLYALNVLERGYDAPRKRRAGTIEKWLNKGNKTYNAVIAKDYNEIAKENVWVLVHFGKFTRRKIKNEMPQMQ